MPPSHPLLPSSKTASSPFAKMKLLGWMHRKFRQNGSDGLKELGGGGGGTCNCLCGRLSLDDDRHSRSLRRRQYEPFKARSLRPDVGVLDDEGGSAGDPVAEDPFGGLLTIGTLGIGSEPIEENEEEDEMAYPAEDKSFVAASAEPVVTPAALEAIAEKEAEATTETDLMVVSEELEKMLAAEAEMGGGQISSARSSQAGAAACPLQGFLFGSAVEAAETTTTAAAGGARRERRASLGELFMISRIAEEGGGGEKEEEGKFARGDDGHDGEGKLTTEMYQMKKKMTKRRGGKGSDGDGSSNGSTVETKLQKILQIFHRKVHPESNGMSKKSSKTSKIEKKDYVPRVGGNDPTGTSGSIVFALKGGCRKENPPSINFCSNPPSYSFGGIDLNGNREHWIKTDAEYLVLEL